MPQLTLLDRAVGVSGGPPDRPIEPRHELLSPATVDFARLLLTTAVPRGARDSRANYRQNRRAGDEREGKCSKNDELLHDGLFLSEDQPAS